MKHWETHLYSYAYAVLQSQDNAAAMRAKAIRHGHTEGECLCVARDPQHYITNGTFAPYRTELAPHGEQTVIPGCERNLSPKATQLDLF